MKNVLLFLLLIVFLSKISSLQSKIDLFQFNQAQNFENENKKKNSSSPKKIETASSNSQSNDSSIKTNEPNNPTSVKSLLELLVKKYENLRKEVSPRTEKVNPEILKIRNNLIFNTMRFKESPQNSPPPEPSLFDSYDRPPQFNSDSSSDLQQSHASYSANAKINVSMFPYNSILKPGGVMPENERKDIFIDKSLIKQLKFNRKFGLQTSIKSIPIQECSVHWDYVNHGDNWACLCEIGRSQSPIDISTSKVSKSNDDVYMDLKTPKECGDDPKKSTCKFPLIKHTGKTIAIDYQCGYLVNPGNGFGYKCERIEFHTPSEHKINGKHYDMEMQVYFKIDKTKLERTENKEMYTVLVVLFEGVDDKILSRSNKFSSFVNPFLEALQLDNLPNKTGDARLIGKILDFEQLFNMKIQPPEQEIRQMIRKHNKDMQFTKRELKTFKKAIKNENKISHNVSKNSNLKERQKLYYKPGLRNYQNTIISRIKGELKQKKQKLADLKKMHKNNTLDGTADQFDYIFDEEGNGKKKLQPGKIQGKPNKNDKNRKKSLAEDIKTKSGIFDLTKEPKPSKKEMMMMPENNNNEDMRIENEINRKMDEDLKMFDHQRKDSLFSSFLDLTKQFGRPEDDLEGGDSNPNEFKIKKEGNPYGKGSDNYNPFYPLSEFYEYSGSETTPPCEEKHTYIVYGKPVFARLSQIIKISSLISSTVFKLGNNRNIQNPHNREVYHFSKSKSFGPQMNFLEKSPEEFLQTLVKNNLRSFKDGKEIMERALKMKESEFAQYMKSKEME